MAAILLSGVGGSTNWLPLVFPLAGVLFVIYAIDFLMKFIKKWKLHHSHMTHDHSSAHEDTSGPGEA